jgi:hypothetical protein
MVGLLLGIQDGMRMKEYVVTSVETYWPNETTECWYITMRKPDGTDHIHIFPKHTLEARAAEYDIADIDTLLDIVLHEPWAPHPSDSMTAQDDPALALGLTRPAPQGRGKLAPGQPEGVTLHTAATIPQARQAHLARIAWAKANAVRVTPPRGAGRDPLQQIRDDPRIDPTRVAQRRVVVAADRARIQRGRNV